MNECRIVTNVRLNMTELDLLRKEEQRARSAADKINAAIEHKKSTMFHVKEQIDRFVAEVHHLSEEITLLEEAKEHVDGFLGMILNKKMNITKGETV